MFVKHHMKHDDLMMILAASRLHRNTLCFGNFSTGEL